MRVECELKQKKINIFEINKVFDEIEEILSQSEKQFKTANEFNEIFNYLKFERKYVELYVDYEEIRKENKDVKICL